MVMHCNGVGQVPFASSRRDEWGGWDRHPWLTVCFSPGLAHVQREERLLRNGITVS